MRVEPCIEVSDLGIWYPRRRQKSFSMRQVLSGGLWRDRRQVVWALREVTFQCHNGEVVGIIGPNGAGKSTLCLTLAGILTPDEGSAHVRGKISALLSLGAGFDKELTGRENIRLNASFLGIQRSELSSQIDQIIEFGELSDVIDQPMRTYSSGMRVRLGFSVAAIIQPEILILDEVLAVGDVAFQKKSQRRIEEMIASSKAIIVVSHQMELLRDLCTHCVWLEAGRLRASGEASAILDAYEEESVSRGRE
ncbi:MAG: ABC transporter ATP-binding protein [bacterium]|nr:ABC transporter ATP-binding protein [bacterium]